MARFAEQPTVDRIRILADRERTVSALTDPDAKRVTPENAVAGATAGPNPTRHTNMGEFSDAIHRRRGEAGVRSILGLLTLARKHGVTAVEHAASDALEISVRIPAKATIDSDVKAAAIPGNASTRRSEATLGRVIISEVDGFGQTRTAFEV